MSAPISAGPIQLPGDRPAAPSQAHGALWVAIALVAFASGLGVGYAVWGGATGSRPGAPAAAAAQPTRYDISLDDDPSMGPSDALVTIVEFSDYSCGSCRRWHEQVYPALMAAYPDQIRLVYRDLPVVGGGAVGFLAAQAADCAGDQGAYWRFHDALFAAQYGLSREAYLQYAEDLGLDTVALAECLHTRYHADEVQADRDYAYDLGITSTPTFFINGIPIVGAQPLAAFQQIIDGELAQ